MAMLFSVISIFILVILDQLSKWWATVFLAPVGTMPFLPGIMQLTYALNDGAAFSMLAGRQKMLILITTVTLLVMLALLLWDKGLNGWERWGLRLIIGGGIGNLIDRVLNGVVVDYFEVTFVEYAIFNVADCFVTVGCILLCIGILFGDKAAQKKRSPAEVTDGQSDGAKGADASAGSPDAAANERSAAAAEQAAKNGESRE